MRLDRIALLCFSALTSLAVAQTTARYRPLLENGYVSAFALELRPHFQAPLYQNTHDLFWIALDEATTTFIAADGSKNQQQFSAGDTRAFRSYRLKSVWNTGPSSFRAVLVELKKRGALSSACYCTDKIESAVCGCGPPQHLPTMWATGIGQIMVGGTTLQPGQSYERTARRGNMLLVAVSTVQLRDEAAEPGAPAEFHLQAGEVTWLKAGWHKFKNAGNAAARFVSFEF